MFTLNSKSLFKSLIFIVVLLFFCLNSVSVVYHNHGNEGYNDDSSGSRDSYIAENPINNYIIEGAGYFLSGYSDVLSLLNRFEMAEIKGIDYNEVKQVSVSVLNNLKNTAAVYDSLIALAETTPYNETFIEKLACFDYKTFRENNSLNNDVFKEVEAFLSSGDITGTFKRSSKTFDQLLDILNSIKIDIDAEQMPSLTKLWKLNQVYAAELLFGQYTAQVYYSLINND